MKMAGFQGTYVIGGNARVSDAFPEPDIGPPVGHRRAASPHLMSRVEAPENASRKTFWESKYF